MKNLTRTTLTLFAAAALWSCGGGDSHDHADGDQDHAEEGDHDEEEHGHAHHPIMDPENGVLVELGDHEANLEIGFDADAGALTIYTLDAHATETSKSSQESMIVTIEPDEGDAFDLTLGQVASSLSGETVGDSATYKVQDDRLKGMEHLHGTVKSTLVMGATYTDVGIWWPAGDHDHSHDDEEGGDH